MQTHRALLLALLAAVLAVAYPIMWTHEWVDPTHKELALACPLCREAVGAAQGANLTMDDLRVVLKKDICDHLPSPLRGVCEETVDKAAVGSRYLNFSPGDFCSLMDFCTNDCCIDRRRPEQPHLMLDSVAGDVLRLGWTTYNLTAPGTQALWLGTDPNALAEVEGLEVETDTYYGGGWRGHVHSARLPALIPGVRYFYELRGNMGWAAAHFKQLSFVAPDPRGALAKRLRVACVGDMGVSHASEGTFVQLGRLAERGDIDMVLHAGDLAYANGLQRLWDTFMERLTNVAGRVPYMVAPGNHERASKFLSFRKRFAMPGMGANAPMYYSFNIGSLHVLVLDSENDVGTVPDLGPGTEVHEFAVADLKKVDRTVTPWVLVMHHRPLYCPDMLFDCYSRANKMRASLEDVYVAGGVDVVLNGHVHSASRTWPVKDNGTHVERSFDSPTAPVHITSGAAGNREGISIQWSDPLPKYTAWTLPDSPPHTGFGIFDVTPTAMTWSWVDAEADGKVIDRFTITK